MFNKRISYLVIPIFTFVLLFSVIIILYEITITKHRTLVETQVLNIGKFIAKEFKNIYLTDISTLENLKERLEFTDGAYYENWENDALLILNQNPSFKFIEWIDSSMVIRKITPLKGNEEALNLDISKIEYRRDEWLKHSKSRRTNITPWAELTQSGNSFLVDVPVYYNNKFQGTITAGMDFKTNFDRIVDYLNDQFSIELYDENGTLFYSVNKDIILNKHGKINYNEHVIVDDSDLQSWQLVVYPTSKLKIEEGKELINIAFIAGLFLSVIVSFLIHFYLKAKKGTKLAMKSNLELTTTNEKLNIEREKAEKASQAKTDFLSNMSHEIRTPLHAIIGLIQLVKNSKLDKANREYIDLMDKSSNNLLNLVNDILDIDKIESGSTELDEVLFSPLEKIKEIVDVNQFLFLKKNLYFKTDFENTLGLNVIGDQNKMLQIVNNILKNALKFTNKGGVKLTYSEIKTENQLETNIIIEDTGIGIPKDKIETIFNRFTQIDSSIKKQYEGSGLGLAITKHLITMLGGKITIESKINKGSTFKVSILFKIAENQEKEILVNIKKDINLSELNVLIVDDNNINIIVLKNLLESMGIKADTAESGKIAIQKVKQNNYQLIFMDIHMPEMDGFETTKIIRSFNKNVVIFGLSANVTTQAINKSLTSGMNNYLPKPFKKDLLYKMLQFHFNNIDL